MNSAPVILVCDDDQDDQLLIESAFAEACIDAGFRFAGDGTELIEYLQSNGVEHPRPDIILLDLNMPKMDGRRTLEWIKSHPEYRAIPVVIYTTTRERSEIQRCYRTGANSFMTKCSTFKDLVEKVEVFARYWMDITELPKSAGCQH
jgi:CheY-like chemotaxis protein